MFLHQLLRSISEKYKKKKGKEKKMKNLIKYNHIYSFHVLSF